MREHRAELPPGRASEKSPGPSLFRQKLSGSHPWGTVPVCSHRKPSCGVMSLPRRDLQVLMTHPASFSDLTRQSALGFLGEGRRLYI